MSVASAVAAYSSVAAISAATPTFVSSSSPLHVNTTLQPSPVTAPITAGATVERQPSPGGAVRRHRLRRRAYVYRTQGRREARLYSWPSRSFLSADRHSQTVTLSKRGNSIYGMVRASLAKKYQFIYICYVTFGPFIMRDVATFLNNSNVALLVYTASSFLYIF